MKNEQLYDMEPTTDHDNTTTENMTRLLHMAARWNEGILVFFAILCVSTIAINGKWSILGSIDRGI